MKEKSFCCSLTQKLAGMESVYFAACNFKTTDKSGNISAGLQEFPNGMKVSFRKSV